MAKFKVIRSSASLPEAQVIRGLLESAGIHVQITSDNVGGLEPHLSLQQGVHIAVDESVWARAQKIIEESLNTSDEDSSNNL